MKQRLCATPARESGHPWPHFPISFSLLLSIALCACSPHDPQAPQPKNAPQPQAASSVVLNSPLGTLVKDRDRAKAVQNIVDSQVAKQSSAIDDQSH
ncbi:MAG TPA: hypothetical protein VN693_00590 [Rhodanobacteraceae bacterium]|nr:hypothetical protein [Rhodanobacteraceae bacterium]